MFVEQETFSPINLRPLNTKTLQIEKEKEEERRSGERSVVGGADVGALEGT